MISPFRDEVGCSDYHVVDCGDQHWNFVAAGRFQNLLEQLHRRIEHIGWAHVDLRYHNEHRDVECKRKPKVLCERRMRNYLALNDVIDRTFGHADYAHVRSYGEHGKVGGVPGEPKHGRLQVLLVPSEIDKCQDLVE